MESLEERKKDTRPRINKLYQGFYYSGIILIIFSAIFLLWNFFPAIYQEAHYAFSKKDKAVSVVTKKEAESFSKNDISKVGDIIEPIDENFGIVIPKIRANAKVIPNVDPNDSATYQKVLTQGVASTKGSVAPGKEGNIFIFAHSGIDFYEAERYNAVFYLLDKLEKGDEIFIFYKGEKIRYAVTESKTVGADETKYYDGIPGKKTLTLMTCWPAGTNLKRYIVIAEAK